MNVPRLFMVIYVKEQHVRLVFHGTLTEDEQNVVMQSINAAGWPRVKFAIVEKFVDSDFQYTICTLDSLYTPDLDRKLCRLYPDAKKLKLDKTSAIRDTVRAIIIT